MTTTKSILLPLIVTPGVQPATDKTALSTPHFTFSDKIRFRFGFPQKIGGWYSIPIAYGNEIMGIARSMFSAILSTSVNTAIGTNTNVYSLSGSVLTNITPLSTTATTEANSLSNDFQSLGSNPIATVNGSNILTISYVNAYIFNPGDKVTISGATAFNGLTTGNLNMQFEIHTVPTSTSITVIAPANANATGSGGGASVKWASGLMNMAATTTGFKVGDRVKIALAGSGGGISGATIDGEYIIRNVITGFFYFMTTGTATSSVLLGGGASTTLQVQIAGGAANESFGQGYGMGFYGVGLYGTALMSSSALSYPRIWFMDRYGANIILTPGNQGGVYTWSGSNATAPTLVANAPVAVNYAFVSDNILVTLGAGGIVNQIFSSDQGNITQWTASSSNQVFQDVIEGAGQWRSHVSVNGANLIFTDHQTYLFQYTGYTAGVANGIWNVQQIENNIGIISPMARCAVLGTAYWMGQNNFYMWSGGGNVQAIPANSQENSTILNYVFKNINRGQSAKCYGWYNEQYDEIWFHYPSAGSNECDSVARVNRADNTWCPDTFDRSCAEYPNLTLGYPRLISSESILYAHEQGNDADGAAMPWQLTTNLRGGSNLASRSAGIIPKENSLMTAFVPDSVQTGNINVEITTKLYPQSAVDMYVNNYTITPTTDLMPIEQGGRLWQYNLTGEELGQMWICGQWHEYIAPSSAQ